MDQWKAYELKCRSNRKSLFSKYRIVGFIASGTYGKVYKAYRIDTIPNVAEFAIKKFKPDENALNSRSNAVYGLSQSACRETSLCTELNHENIVHLEEIFVDPLDKSLNMVFEYAEHDLLQILHHHAASFRTPIPLHSVKSFLWQILNGVDYLHSNWVLHRDLKPANILVSSSGMVKIADLGLARLFTEPLQSLSITDRVVVTIWYRAPELLLGSKHYTTSVDIWAIGCIFAELLLLKPIFKGEEIVGGADSKKIHPFQTNQMEKISSILGLPSQTRWPLVVEMPEYKELIKMGNGMNKFNSLKQYISQTSITQIPESALDLISRMLDYDPSCRISAKEALDHAFFKETPIPSLNSLRQPNGLVLSYPRRLISKEEAPFHNDSRKRQKM